MIFEPHRFTRTQQLFDDFVKVLSQVDSLLLLDIYPASEKPIKGISSKKLISEIAKNHKNAEYIGKTDPLVWLQSNYESFSILITQGAGTISKLNKKIKQHKWQ
jgi:UDP-N-acetylmuramate--alanine ligase